MKTTSSKPKGQRIFKCQNHMQRYGLKFKRPFTIEPLGGNWWFSLKKGQWVQGYNGEGGMSSSYYCLSDYGFNNAYSLKAVKRLIHKWNVPKGTVFIASLPWVGYEFKITK
jgi:hypothetical protein